MDEPSDPHRGQAGLFGQRVDRIDPARRWCGVVVAALVRTAQHLDRGADHLELVSERRDRTEEERKGADRQLLGPPRLIEEHDRHPPTAIGDLELDPRRGPAATSRAGRRGADPGHRGQNGGLLPLSQLPDRCHATTVDVAPRIVRDQVEHRGDAQLGQIGSHRGAHAPQHSYRESGQLAEAAASNRLGRTRGRRFVPNTSSCRGCARFFPMYR